MKLYHIRAKYRFVQPDSGEEWWQEAKDCTWYSTEAEALELIDDLNKDLPPAGREDEYNPFTETATDAPNRRVWCSRKGDELLCLECIELPTEHVKMCEFLNGIHFMGTGSTKPICRERVQSKKVI